MLIALAFWWQPASLAIPQPATQVEELSTSITVKTIKVQGATIFPEQEINKIIQVYHGKKLDFLELSQITQALTELYVSKGYITSGAFFTRARNC